MAVTRFVDNASDTEATEELARHFLLHENASPAERKALLERLAVFPIIDMGPILESTHTPDEIRLMYTDGVVAMKELLKNYHDDTCVTNDLFAEPACENSSTCPLRTTAAYLLHGVYDREFDNLDYMVDPVRSRQLALAKAMVARDSSIGAHKYIEEMIAYYVKDHDEYLDNKTK